MSATRSSSQMSNTHRKALMLKQSMGGYTQLPMVRSNSTTLSKQSYNPGCPWDRFTKLKGTLVNNLLSKYNKTGGKGNNMRPDLVYNAAVLAVEDILKRGKVTEQSLKEMQKNFAEGVVKIPIEWSKQHNIHQHVRSMPQPRREVTSKPTTAATMRQGAHTSMALMPGVSEMEEEIVWKNTAGNTGGEEANRQQQQQQQTQEGDIQVQKKHKTKTAPDMDDWTKMILLKDVKHLEKEKKKKQDKVKEKEEQAKFLDMQLEWRQRQKIKSREGKREYAADLERRAQELEDEKRKAEEIKKVGILKENEYEAKAIAEIKQRREAEVMRDKREAEEQLAIYAAQISAEKEEHKAQLVVKAKQYEEVLKENNKALERKRLVKEQEAKEQERLFKIQNDMYDKQEALRLAAEEARLERLRKGERQGKELADKAAEMEHKVHVRFLEAQAKQEMLAREDAKRKAEKKKRAGDDFKASLVSQMEYQESIRRREEEEKAAIAVKYKREAKEFEDERRAEKVQAAEKRKEAAATLAKQIELKKKIAGEVVMTRAELAINAREVKEVQPISPEQMLSMYQSISPVK